MSSAAAKQGRHHSLNRPWDFAFCDFTRCATSPFSPARSGLGQRPVEFKKMGTTGRRRVTTCRKTELRGTRTVSRNRCGAVLRAVRMLFDSGTIGGLTDADLVGRFVDRGDETVEPAFAALVER